MHDGRVDDLLMHPVKEHAQIIGAILDELHERPGRQWRTEPV
jgi:hypothetical protein